jgi:hypothetical protein
VYVANKVLDVPSNFTKCNLKCNLKILRLPIKIKTPSLTGA